MRQRRPNRRPGESLETTPGRSGPVPSVQALIEDLAHPRRLHGHVPLALDAAEVQPIAFPPASSTTTEPELPPSVVAS